MKRLSLNIRLAPLFMADAGGGGGTDAPQQQQQQRPKNDPMVKLAEILGVDPAAKPEEFLSAAQGLKTRIADSEAQAATRAEEETAIAAKTSRGLTREQALAVIKRQKEHDAAIAQQWEKRRPDIIAVLKTVTNPREQRKQINELFPGLVHRHEIEAAKAAMKGASK